jgi:hypothetical protein
MKLCLEYDSLFNNQEPKKVNSLRSNLSNNLPKIYPYEIHEGAPFILYNGVITFRIYYRFSNNALKNIRG